MTLLAITGLSWAWKSTLRAKLLDDYSEVYSNIIISTDRKPRISLWWINNEVPGVDYHFTSKEELNSWSYIFSFTKWNNTYWFSNDEYLKMSQENKVWLIACGNEFINKVLKFHFVETVVAFLGTSESECINRMKVRWDWAENIESRIKIFREESLIKESANIILPQDYIIEDVHKKIMEIIDFPKLCS